MVLQVGDVVGDPLHLPPWVMTVLIIAIVVALPIVVIVAWFSWRTEVRRDGETFSVAVGPPERTRNVIDALFLIAFLVLVGWTTLS